MISFGDLNLLVILVASVVYFILGGVWFAPFAFGKMWDTAIGFDRPPKWKPTAKFYVGPLIGCFLATLATGILIGALDIQGYEEAGILGLIVGIGYAVSISIVNAITPKTPRPFLQGLITGTYHTFGIITVAIIIVALR